MDNLNPSIFFQGVFKMVIVRKKRKSVRKAIRKARRNPARKKMAGKRVRPLLWKRGKGSKVSYHRGPKSKMPQRINKRRRVRRNGPLKLKGIFSKTAIMNAVSIASGIGAGFLAMPLIIKIIPEKNRAQFNDYMGLAHVALGLVMASMLKNKNLKAMGAVIAGTGVYDLIACNIPQLDLPRLPRTSVLFDQMDGTMSITHQGSSYPTAQLPVNMGASYERVGASYEPSGLSGMYADMGL